MRSLLIATPSLDGKSLKTKYATSIVSVALFDKWSRGVSLFDATSRKAFLTKITKVWDATSTAEKKITIYWVID